MIGLIVARSKNNMLQEAIAISEGENLYIAGGEDIKYTRTIYTRNK